jgi:hypothetical protein
MAHLKQKHYESVAKIIREYRGACCAAHEDVAVVFLLRFIVQRLADYFEEENPKFNRAKFYKQAGITP